MSEPRLALLHNNSGRWSAHDRPEEALTMNSCESWVFAFGGDFINTSEARSSEIERYDIIIANTDLQHLKKLLRLCQSRPASTKWVTLIEGDALDYARPRPYIRDLFDSSDLVNCINKYTEGFFKQLTTTPVEYIGFPYPAEGIRALATPFDKRRKEIFLGPMLLKRWLEYFVVKDLGVPYYGYERRLTRKLKTLVPNLRDHKTLNPHYFHNKVRTLYNDPSLTIIRESGLADFFRHNGGAHLWMNLDDRYTWGRYILDAAALQVPIISTRSTGHAETFFPKTMVETEFQIEEVRQLVNRLLTDREFYTEVAAIPIESFNELRPEVKKKQLLQALFP